MNTHQTPLDILLIDDNELDRRAFHRAIETSGLKARVYEATNIDEGLAALQSQKFDCIFLDYVLPDGNGMEILQAVHAHQITTPILMLTGSMDESQAVSLLRTGAADYLNKSEITPKVLAHSIRRLIRIQRAEEQTRAAQVALHDSEERFRLIVENVKDYAIFALDIEGNIVTWNPGVARLKGYSSEEVLGKNFSLFYPPEEIANGKPQWVLEIVRQQGNYEEEGWRIRKDGSRFWASIVISPIRDKDGRLQGFVKVTRDLTERRKAQNELNAFFDLSQDALGLCGFDGSFKRLNAAWPKTFGFSSEELMAMPWLDLMHPEDQVKAMDFASGLIASGGAGMIELRCRCKDGSYRELQWNVTASPEQQCFIVVGRDVTELRQTVETLRSREALLQGVVETAVDGIITIDECGRMQSFNPAAERTFGYAAEEAIGWNVSMLMPEPDSSAHDGYLHAYLQTGVRKIIGIGREVVGKRRDGSVFPLDLAVSSFSQGESRYFVGTVRDITERKQAEEALQRSQEQLRQANVSLEQQVMERTAALRNSEEQLRLVLDAAPAGIAFVDKEQRYLFCNRLYASWFRCSPDEILGKPIREILGNERYARARTHIDLALSGECVSFDMDMHFAGEYDSSVHVNYVPDIEPSGKVNGFVVMVVDITERKQAQDHIEKLAATLQETNRELAASEQLFRTMFDSAAVGMARVGLDSKWLDANRKMCEIVGYSRGELNALRFQDITHPDDLDADLAQTSRLLAGDIASFSIEKRYIRKDGVPIWTNMTVALVRDTADVPQYFVAMIKDISTRKAAQEALTDSEARYRFLADAMPNTVWTAKPNGDIDYCSQRWFDYSGMTLEETQNWGWQALIHPDDLQPTLEQWTHVIATGEPYSIETRYRRGSDANYRWHLTRAIPRRDAHGNILQWVGSVTDIQEVKEAQAALLRMNEALEARVNERTEALTRSNSDLQQFAYVASHDLQEPLRMVASFVQLLEKRYKGQIDEQADRWIGHAVDGTKRMQTLISDLLVYSRVGTEGQEFASCDANEVLREVLQSIQLLTEESDSDVSYDILPVVHGDAVQLRSLFQNLIENAIKYRSDLPPEIHISAQREERFWRFVVRDNGIGIAPQFAERIFVIFQRLHTRTKYSGTGIGLALCKRIVERHGGRIWMESEPAKGTTFFFTLPDGQGVNP